MFILKYTTCRFAVDLQEVYRSQPKEDSLHGVGSLIRSHHCFHPKSQLFTIYTLILQVLLHNVLH